MFVGWFVSRTTHKLEEISTNLDGRRVSATLKSRSRKFFSPSLTLWDWVFFFIILRDYCMDLAEKIAAQCISKSVLEIVRWKDTCGCGNGSWPICKSLPSAPVSCLRDAFSSLSFTDSFGSLTESRALRKVGMVEIFFPCVISLLSFSLLTLHFAALSLSFLYRLYEWILIAAFLWQDHHDGWF